MSPTPDPSLLCDWTLTLAVAERLGRREIQLTHQGYWSLLKDAAPEAWEEVPAYHLLIEACEQDLAPWMTERGWRLSLHEDTGAGRWHAAWVHDATGARVGRDAPAPAAAICRAFLAATASFPDPEQ
jgi:hypothetical protein